MIFFIHNTNFESTIRQVFMGSGPGGIGEGGKKSVDAYEDRWQMTESSQQSIKSWETYSWTQPAGKIYIWKFQYDFFIEIIAHLRYVL